MMRALQINLALDLDKLWHQICNLGIGCTFRFVVFFLIFECEFLFLVLTYLPGKSLAWKWAAQLGEMILIFDSCALARRFLAPCRKAAAVFDDILGRQMIFH